MRMKLGLLVFAAALCGLAEANRNRVNGTLKCSLLTDVNSSARCSFVRKHCHLGHGYFNYLRFPYCSLPSAPQAGFAVLVLWLLYLFIILGVTADEFFCPCLHSLAKILHMSDSMAGVTLLALGNGAPDIFSVLAAVTSPTHAASVMGFQELFGAGIFVTTVVAGCIQLKASFRFARRPFTRDVLFYLSAVIWTFVIMYKRTISTAESAGFIVLYIAYVIFVVAGQAINRRLRRSRSQDLPQSPDPLGDLEESALFSDAKYSLLHSSIGTSIQSASSTEHSDTSINMKVVPPHATFTSRALNVSNERWRTSSVLQKVFIALTIPAKVVLNLTIPVVDMDVQGYMFNKHLLFIQCLIFPTASLLLIRVYDIGLYGPFVMWHCSLGVGGLLALLVLVCCKSSMCPSLYPVFTLPGFIMSVIWIYATANEVVHLLQGLGIAFGLSNAIIGLTLLAWGNSIGDLVSNLAVALRGTPRMAIAACFGGPLLNMLLGVGISCTVSAVANGDIASLIRGNIQYIVSAGFLALSLLSSLVFMATTGFHANKFYAIYLIVLYAGFVAMSVIIELNVIQF